MKVNSITNNLYKSKPLKDGLAYAANKPALFIAATQLALSTFVRPLSIMATPKTDSENKKLACVKSISSSLVYYLLMLGVSLPVSNGVEKMTEQPEKYMKKETIKNFKEAGKKLGESKGYQFATQLFKLGTGVVAAAPKAILTCLLMPPILAVMGNMSKKKDKNVNITKVTEPKQLPIIDKDPFAKLHNTNKPSFKGNIRLNPVAKGMGKVLDKPSVQKFSDRFKDSNFGMHAMALTDIINTGAFIWQNNKSKTIEDNRKRTLNYNAGISTGLSIIGGYVIDKALDKPTEKFIKKFSEANKADEKLTKYIEGIKIAKPTMVFGLIYYGIIPLVSTFIADRLDCTGKNDKKKSA
ncbi:MAG: hypothetical protein NC200_01325 [Candidatus Gastranaerophilales bacterium]|nr:hypothetical protein [Candidatus Gastranaerophilales bacterium]